VNDLLVKSPRSFRHHLDDLSWTECDDTKTLFLGARVSSRRVSRTQIN